MTERTAAGGARLAVTGGRASDTGVGGLALGSGSALKTRWDPTNLFRHNQNIPPATKR